MEATNHFDFEAVMRKFCSMSEVREGAEQFNSLPYFLQESLRPVKEGLDGLLRRLRLKDEPFGTFDGASDFEIGEFFSVAVQLENLLTRNHTEKKCLPKLPDLSAFLDHCCNASQYM